MSDIPYYILPEIASVSIDSTTTINQNKMYFILINIYVIMDINLYHYIESQKCIENFLNSRNGTLYYLIDNYNYYTCGFQPIKYNFICNNLKDKYKNGIISLYFPIERNKDYKLKISFEKIPQLNNDSNDKIYYITSNWINQEISKKENKMIIL